MHSLLVQDREIAFATHVQQWMTELKDDAEAQETFLWLHTGIPFSSRDTSIAFSKVTVPCSMVQHPPHPPCASTGFSKHWIPSDLVSLVFSTPQFCGQKFNLTRLCSGCRGKRGA